MLTFLSRHSQVHLAIALFFIVIFTLAEHGDDWRAANQYHTSEFTKGKKDPWYKYPYTNFRQYWGNLFSTITQPYRRMEDYFLDYRHQTLRKTKTASNFIFLPIDGASTSLDGPNPEEIDSSPALQLMKKGYPFPRELYALVCDRLFAAGAKVVVFDIWFPGATPGDPLWAAAIEKYKDKLVIGMNFTPLNLDTGVSSQTHWNLSLPSDSLFPDQDETDDRLGYLNYWPDADDDKIRTVRVFTNTEILSHIKGGEKLPLYDSLATRALQKAGYASFLPHETEPISFRFAGQAGSTFPTQSLYRIFVPHFWKTNFDNGSVFKDKIVMVGPQGAWSKDEFSTPMGQMAGAEVHLQVMNAILQKDFLYPCPISSLLLTAITLMTFVINVRFRFIVTRFALFLLLVGVYITVVFLLFDGPGLILPMAGPILSSTLTSFVGLVYDFRLERQEKQRIRSRLERAVSKNVVKEMVDNPETFYAALTSGRKAVTILFSDIRGFTAMTEQADSDALVKQLNEYLSAMVRCVFATDGTLDKFIGDAVMANWGSLPGGGPHADAVKAVTSALLMQAELKKLNEKWIAEGRDPWKIGIGLNHGLVVVGEIGSPEKSDITTIGDAVNLASRIEGLTKHYHVEILIGETVAFLVMGDFYLQSVDIAQVSGRQTAVKLYAVLGKRSDPITEDFARFMEYYETGIDAFRSRRFAEAREFFALANLHHPDDYLAKKYYDLAAELELNPPDESWTGVTNFKTK